MKRYLKGLALRTAVSAAAVLLILFLSKNDAFHAAVSKQLFYQIDFSEAAAKLSALLKVIFPL